MDLQRFPATWGPRWATEATGGAAVPKRAIA